MRDGEPSGKKSLAVINEGKLLRRMHILLMKQVNISGKLVT